MAAALTLAGLLLGGCTGTQEVNRWVEPGYVPAEPSQIAVLAKLESPENRRVMENAAVRQLKAAGFAAIAAYEAVDDEDLADKDRFVGRLKAQYIDALIVYRVVRERTDYKKNPEAKAKVGVPIDVGAFDFWVGSSVPLAGGGKRADPRAEIEAAYYQKDAAAAHWKATYDLQLSDGVNQLAEWVAQQTVTHLKEDGVLP